MKTLLVVASLTLALAAFPVAAQQGPAGVPGAPGLVPEPPPAPARSAEPTQRPKVDCKVDKNAPQCKSRASTPRKPRDVCQTKAGAGLKQCEKTRPAGSDCSKATDPTLCARHAKAREVCKDKTGAEHRQCLRDTLTGK